MNCLYYLAPTLESTHRISDDLHAAGLKDFFLHVISKDESGLEQEHIHSSNYLETLDIVRDGFIGAAIGAVAGLVGAGLLMYFAAVRSRCSPLRLFRDRRRGHDVRRVGRWPDRDSHGEQESQEIPPRHRGRQVPDPDLCAEGAGRHGQILDARTASGSGVRRGQQAFRQPVPTRQATGTTLRRAMKAHCNGTECLSAGKSLLPPASSARWMARIVVTPGCS